MPGKKIVLLLTAMLIVAACGQKSEPVTIATADRVFTNGAIYTVDEERRWAQAVAIKDGRIVYVGDDDGAADWIGDGTEQIDLAGQMMLPGFHDSHVHILMGVMADDECDLLRIPTAEEVAAKLKACTALAGIGDDGWILGGGWGEWLWPEANPQKGLLDILFPKNPVYLESSFGHAAWVNSRAMEIVGINGSTPNPDAGIIERDPETGEPSGTLRESAMMLVKDKIPPMTLAQLTARVHAAVDYAHSFGITAVIEPGLGRRGARADSAPVGHVGTRPAGSRLGVANQLESRDFR